MSKVKAVSADTPVFGMGLVDVHCLNVSGIRLGRESADALSFNRAVEGSRAVGEASRVMSGVGFIFLPACSVFSFRDSAFFDAGKHTSTGTGRGKVVIKKSYTACLKCAGAYK